MKKLTLDDFAKSNRQAQRKAAAIASHANKIVANAAEQAGLIKSNRKLSDIGKREAINETFIQHFREFRRVRRDVEMLQKSLEATRPALPPLNKDDVAGAILDVECRTFVRQSGITDVKLLPDRVVAAIVRGDPILSGISPIVHQGLQNRLIEDAFPEQAADFANDNSALEAAQSALNFAFGKLQHEGGFLDRADFGDWHARAVEPVEREIVLEDVKIHREGEAKRAEESIETLVEQLRSVSSEQRRQVQSTITKIDYEEHRKDMDALREM